MPPTVEHTTLTPWQKLSALAMRFYQNRNWDPDVGDYFTTTRADLNLYQIVGMDHGKVRTKSCDPTKSAILSWDLEHFLIDPTIGYARVWVSTTFLNTPLDEQIYQEDTWHV